jgi:hypothetical protein
VKILRNFVTSLSLFATLAIPAIAVVPVTSTDILITTPATGDEVVSPFSLVASATKCLSQPVASIGYSLDDGPDTLVSGKFFQEAIEAPPGLHTLHIKATGASGSLCLTDRGVAVTPSTAISVSGIQRLGAWSWWKRTDPQVRGTSNGVVSLVNFGFTRQFDTTYTNFGSELYFVSFAADTTAKNFMYDAWVSIASPATGVGILETDMNQVMANGETVIYGFQCDSYTKSWDYTTNSGTPQKPIDEWIHSATYCNPSEWGTNTWHRLQISYSRDDSGNVTYNAVAFDGYVSHIDKTVPSSFALGWAPTLVTNFEVDGNGASGRSTTYLNDLTILRW